MNMLRGDPLPWLLEPDPANPAVRYFALRDLLERSEDDPEVRQARVEIMTTGPVPAILAAQQPEGYWFKAGSGYSPKYQGTVWQIMLLADLGADPGEARVQRGCEYLFQHKPASNGGKDMKDLKGNILDCSTMPSQEKVKVVELMTKMEKRFLAL